MYFTYERIICFHVKNPMFLVQYWCFSTSAFIAALFFPNIFLCFLSTTSLVISFGTSFLNIFSDIFFIMFLLFRCFFSYSSFLVVLILRIVVRANLSELKSLCFFYGFSSVFLLPLCVSLLIVFYFYTVLLVLLF